MDICLLQVLLWEYFPDSGPSYRNGASIFLRDGHLRNSDRLKPCVFWWSREALSPRIPPIEESLNSPTGFLPMPYRVKRTDGPLEPIYNRIRESFIFQGNMHNDPYCIWAHPVVLTLLGGQLPAFKELPNIAAYWDGESYNPHPVMCQFGLVQHVPLSTPAMSLAETDHRFLTLNIRRHFYPLSTFCFCSGSAFEATPNYMKYWLKLQCILRDFRANPMPKRVPVMAFDSDLTLISKLFVIFLISFLFLICAYQLLCTCALLFLCRSYQVSPFLEIIFSGKLQPRIFFICLG